MRISKPSRIRSLLENSEASRLISRARALGQFDALVHKLIPPPLNQHCRVLALQDDTLTIAADSAAWAARLRYQSPQLARQLSAVSGLNLRTVQVRVRSADPVHASRAATARQAVADGNSPALKRTARNITDVRLKSALLRLAGRRTAANR